MDPEPDDPSTRFHAHLDACTRCATRPFDLCALGQILLLLTAPSADPHPRPTAKRGSRA